MILTLRIPCLRLSSLYIDMMCFICFLFDPVFLFYCCTINQLTIVLIKRQWYENICQLWPSFKEFASPDVSLSLVITWERWWCIVFYDFTSLGVWRGAMCWQTNTLTQPHIQFCILHISYTNSTDIPCLLPVAWKNMHTHMNAHNMALSSRLKYLLTLHVPDITNASKHMNVTCTTVLIIVKWPPHWSTDHILGTTGINRRILVLLFVLSFTATGLHP